MKYFAIILVLVGIITGVAYFANTSQQQDVTDANTANTQGLKTKNTQEQNTQKPNDTPNWVGTYKGKKPCDNNCQNPANIEVTLTLDAKGYYRFSEKNWSNQAASTSSNGRFSWSAKADAVTLLNTDGKLKFVLGDNYVYLSAIQNISSIKLANK